MPRARRAARTPVGYREAFWRDYAAGTTWYLTESMRATLHEQGRTPDGERPAGTFAREIFERLLIDLAWACGPAPRAVERSSATRAATRWCAATHGVGATTHRLRRSSSPATAGVRHHRAKSASRGRQSLAQVGLAASRRVAIEHSEDLVAVLLVECRGLELERIEVAPDALPPARLVLRQRQEPRPETLSAFVLGDPEQVDVQPSPAELPDQPPDAVSYTHLTLPTNREV